MACYNASKYLREAIESILNQTYSDFEFLIIDDGSTDNSVEIIKEYVTKDNRIRLEQNDKNRGVSYTRNRGLELASGEWLAIMDADDIAPLNRLQICVEYINSHPDIDAVFGSYQLLSEDGVLGKVNKASFWERHGKDVKAALFFRNIVSNGTCFLRREIITQNHLEYKEDFCGLEDYWMFIHFFEYTDKVEILPEILQYYRVVSTGLSRDNASNKREKRNQRFKEIHDKLLDLWNIQLEGIDYEYYMLSVGEDFPRRNKYISFSKTYNMLNSIKKQSISLHDKELGKSLRRQCRWFWTR